MKSFYIDGPIVPGKLVGPPEPRWALLVEPTGYLRFVLPERPNWWFRLFQRLFLGWRWVPANT